MGMKKIWITCLVAFLVQNVAFSEMRVWRYRSGKEFLGEYDTERLDKVYFKDEHGKAKTVPIEELSARDLKHIRTNFPPPVKVSVKVTKKKKDIHQKTTESQADDDWKVITANAEISLSGRTPFEGTLKAEMFMVAQEIVSQNNMMLAKQVLPVKFPTDERSVTLTQTAETATYMAYTEFRRRGWDYLGYVVLIYAPNGSLLNMETNLKWVTEENVDKLRSFSRMSFFDDDLVKKSTPRPEKGDWKNNQDA